MSHQGPCVGNQRICGRCVPNPGFGRKPSRRNPPREGCANSRRVRPKGAHSTESTEYARCKTTQVSRPSPRREINRKVDRNGECDDESRRSRGCDDESRREGQEAVPASHPRRRLRTRSGRPLAGRHDALQACEPSVSARRNERHGYVSRNLILRWPRPKWTGTLETSPTSSFCRHREMSKLGNASRTNVASRDKAGASAECVVERRNKLRARTKVRAQKWTFPGVE
jgi:hypothetical protein